MELAEVERPLGNVMDRQPPGKGTGSGLGRWLRLLSQSGSAFNGDVPIRENF